MLASILWQGSLPEEDEINQMKEEGYHFVEQADGFRICLPLDNMPSGNYYEDGFSTGFKKEVELHQYLAETEKRAQWITVPSRKMRVYATGRLVGVPESKEDERCVRIFRDTQKSAGLMLKTDRGEAYQIGKTAISTLESRARISGNALGKVSRPVFAEILNQCLKVAKGKALIRLSEGKVRAIHSAEKNGYQVFPLSELFMQASVYINGEYQKTEFQEGYADQSMVTAVWKVSDERLEEVYSEIMEKYGKQVRGKLSATIRICSSDVAASGANIFYSLQEGKHEIALGTDMRLKHDHNTHMKEFSTNLLSTFECYKTVIKKTVEKLVKIPIENPANTMIGVMSRYKFGKKVTAEMVERFKATFGEDPCSAYEVYCGISEVLFQAQSQGASGRSLVELEEKVAKCQSVKWQDYDIPGEVQY